MGAAGSAESMGSRLVAHKTWCLAFVMAHPCRRKLIKIGAKVVSHGRYVTFQMAEVVVSRQMSAEILALIARLRAPPAPT
jgi:hypothetical protein